MPAFASGSAERAKDAHVVNGNDKGVRTQDGQGKELG